MTHIEVHKDVWISRIQAINEEFDVSLDEIMTDDFISRFSRFKSFPELIKAFDDQNPYFTMCHTPHSLPDYDPGHKVTYHSDAYLVWDDFIDLNTYFCDLTEFYSAASDYFIVNQLIREYIQPK